MHELSNCAKKRVGSDGITSSVEETFTGQLKDDFLIWSKAQIELKYDNIAINHSWLANESNFNNNTIIMQHNKDFTTQKEKLKHT